jgi:hypothetical protein
VKQLLKELEKIFKEIKNKIKIFYLCVLWEPEGGHSWYHYREKVNKQCW